MGVREEPSDGIIGKLVYVRNCLAVEHGDPDECVCNLMGQTVRVRRKYGRGLPGTTSYTLWWRLQRVRRDEVVLLVQQTVMERMCAHLR